MTQPTIGGDFAGYEVLRLLGKGGMGKVYLVRNRQLDRTEALKVLSMDSGGDFARRFTQEARTSAALDHPDIVTIYHHGIEDGTPWFTMQYLQGGDLAGAAPLPVDEVVQIVHRAATALDYAHAKGVVHRDIKPGNIQVSRDTDGRIDRVTVLDFGIARLAGTTSLTAANSFIGTLSYSAPEAIDGHQATGASDQYSLACTAFQLLTGTTVFTGTTGELIRAQTSTPPPLISSRNPQLAHLDAIFTRALAKDPAARFGSCAAFAAALGGAQAGTGRMVSQSPAPTLAPPARPVPRPNPQPTPTPGTRPLTQQGGYGQPPGGTPPSTPPPSYPPAQPPYGSGGWNSEPPQYPASQNNSSRTRTTVLLAVLAAVIAAIVIGGAVALSSRDDDSAVASNTTSTTPTTHTETTEITATTTYTTPTYSTPTTSVAPVDGRWWGLAVSPDGDIVRFWKYDTEAALRAAGAEKYDIDDDWAVAAFTTGCAAVASPTVRADGDPYFVSRRATRAAARDAALEQSQSRTGKASQVHRDLCVGDVME